MDISELVERYRRNKEAYASGQYNETQLRREFLDPFFALLGWDIDNKSGYAEAYKDVVHEDAIKIGVSTKAPDYSFRIGGTRKFFVEAKKPSIHIKDDPDPAFQLRRYAWSAKLPLSILTDFGEFAVYDCRLKPDKTDKASTGRILYITFDEYGEKWDYLSSIFSREAVLQGSFDKYAESTKTKKGTAEVDTAFLKEIELWRELLARNLALRNPELTRRELNFVVQATIDRIVFLRICEDRGIEDYGRLMSLLNGIDAYKRLCQFFRLADDKYNSGLFHFRGEKDRPEPPDDLSLSVFLDDKTLKEIVKNLYYPDSPYEFSVLPADILGQVYEQFLGKVIHLSAGHRATIEDKPEVKKAGGVFYTPRYIVDYIVKNTVGKLLEGKTPKQAAALKILDPACGSGSFLIGAYQCLLDRHRDWYAEHTPEKWATGRKPVLYQAQGGEWRLTTIERKRILLNNIYGVDIDPQAVEVTKLSLLLKVLEGETDQSVSRQGILLHERVLPDLGGNIKCGNSLIGPDFYEGRLTGILDEEERLRVNVFDWRKEFPEIMTDGGFDAVIGNPPYGASISKDEADYFLEKYKVFRDVKDVYGIFMELSFMRIKENGKFSLIVPSAWLGGPTYKTLRNILLNYKVDNILLLPFDIFADAYVDTTIFVATKSKLNQFHKVHTFVYGKHVKLTKIELAEDSYDLVTQEQWVNSADKKFILNPKTLSLMENIFQKTKLTLDDVITIKRGVLFDRALLTDDRTSEICYRYFEGDVYRYHVNYKAPQWIEFSDKMKERPKEFIWFEGPRILLRRLVNRRQRLMAGFVSDTFITNKNLYSILLKAGNLSMLSVLGLLNSRLISYLYINQITQATKDDFPQVTIKDMLALPLPNIAEEAPNRRMTSLVEQMLILQRQLFEAKTPHEKTAIERQIDATDRQIDALVYELYGLTTEEISIVENIS